MDYVKFKDVEYIIREIELPELGIVLVSTNDLNNALMDNGCDYISEEAKNIDEEIFYFVEKNEILLKDEELINIISREIL